MHKHGTTSDYIDDRNKALLKAYREVMLRPYPIHWREVMNIVVNTPCKRFWVSEEEATRVMRRMIYAKIIKRSTPIRREMYQEIHDRVVALREANPGMTIADATFRVVNSPAPKFYITPSSAYVIIQRTKKKCYEERRRKLRHLL